MSVKVQLRGRFRLLSYLLEEQHCRERLSWMFSQWYHCVRQFLQAKWMPRWRAALFVWRWSLASCDCNDKCFAMFCIQMPTSVCPLLLGNSWSQRPVLEELFPASCRVTNLQMMKKSSAMIWFAPSYSSYCKVFIRPKRIFGAFSYEPLFVPPQFLFWSIWCPTSIIFDVFMHEGLYLRLSEERRQACRDEMNRHALGIILDRFSRCPTCSRACLIFTAWLQVWLRQVFLIDSKWFEVSGCKIVSLAGALCFGLYFLSGPFLRISCDVNEVSTVV